MDGLLAVVHRIVVPKEQSVLDPLLVRFSRGAGNPRKGVAGPKYVDFRIQITGDRIEIADVVGFVSAAAVPSRAEDELGVAILLAQPGKELVDELAY